MRPAARLPLVGKIRHDAPALRPERRQKRHTGSLFVQKTRLFGPEKGLPSCREWPSIGNSMGWIGRSIPWMRRSTPWIGARGARRAASAHAARRGHARRLRGGGRLQQGLPTALKKVETPALGLRPPSGEPRGKTSEKGRRTWQIDGKRGQYAQNRSLLRAIPYETLLFIRIFAHK